ncbi:MAG TPA: hypothetical protein VFZ77_18150 [Acidimicrobiales bacterium]
MFGYLDPGSGSLIASVLVGGVAAAGVAAKQARAKLTGFGRKRKQAPEFSADAEAPQDAAPTSRSTAAGPDA